MTMLSDILEVSDEDDVGSGLRHTPTPSLDQQDAQNNAHKQDDSITLPAAPSRTLVIDSYGSPIRHQRQQTAEAFKFAPAKRRSPSGMTIATIATQHHPRYNPKLSSNAISKISASAIDLARKSIEKDHNDPRSPRASTVSRVGAAEPCIDVAEYSRSAENNIYSSALDITRISKDDTSTALKNLVLSKTAGLGGQRMHKKTAKWEERFSQAGVKGSIASMLWSGHLPVRIDMSSTSCPTTMTPDLDVKAMNMKGQQLPNDAIDNKNLDDPFELAVNSKQDDSIESNEKLSFVASSRLLHGRTKPRSRSRSRSATPGASSKTLNAKERAMQVLAWSIKQEDQAKVDLEHSLNDLQYQLDQSKGQSEQALQELQSARLDYSEAQKRLASQAAQIANLVTREAELSTELYDMNRQIQELGVSHAALSDQARQSSTVIRELIGDLKSAGLEASKVARLVQSSKTNFRARNMLLLRAVDHYQTENDQLRSELLRSEQRMQEMAEYRQEVEDDAAKRSQTLLDQCDRQRTQNKDAMADLQADYEYKLKESWQQARTSEDRHRLMIQELMTKQDAAMTLLRKAHASELQKIQVEHDAALAEFTKRVKGNEQNNSQHRSSIPTTQIACCEQGAMLLNNLSTKPDAVAGKLLDIIASQPSRLTETSKFTPQVLSQGASGGAPQAPSSVVSLESNTHAESVEVIAVARLDEISRSVTDLGNSRSQQCVRQSMTKKRKTASTVTPRAGKRHHFTRSIMKQIEQNNVPTAPNAEDDQLPFNNARDLSMTPGKSKSYEPVRIKLHLSRETSR